VELFEEQWDEGCLDRMMMWNGYTHPLGVDRTKATREDGEAGSACGSYQ
jgi:hypothetical protein